MVTKAKENDLGYFIMEITLMSSKIHRERRSQNDLKILVCSVCLRAGVTNIHKAENVQVVVPDEESVL